MPYRISRDDYIDLILWVLHARGGGGYVQDVISDIEGIIGGYLTAWDHEPLNRSTSEKRWRNAVRWARNSAVEQGLLQPASISGRGYWALSERGRQFIPTARPGPTTWQGGGSGGSHHPSTRSVDLPSRPRSVTGQLELLETVFQVGLSAAPGHEANPAMGQIIGTLERLVRPPQPRTATPAPRQKRRVSRSSGKTSARRPRGPRTGSLGLSVLDASRLDSFIDTTWQPSIKEWLRLEALSEPQWLQLDLMMSLPICATLLAVHRGWITPEAGGARVLRAVDELLRAPRRRKGRLWARLQKEPEDTAPFVFSLLQQGLFHRALCSWLGVLVERDLRELALYSASLRRWIDDLRVVVGEPERWEESFRGSSAWGQLLTSTTSIPAPGDTESDISALDVWLSEQALNRRARSLRNNMRGDLLWGRVRGWGVVVARLAEPNLEVHIVSAGSVRQVKAVISRGPLSEQPWVNIDAMRAEQLLPEPWDSIAQVAGDFARSAVGRKV